MEQLLRDMVDIAAAIADMYADQPSDAATIADQCRQLGAMRDTLGQMPEPVWHACLGVLAHTMDDSLAHEWSQETSVTIHEQTQEKLDRQRAIGPTTCARFEALNPQGCQGCPHQGKIGSPLQLGRDLGTMQDQHPAPNRLDPAQPIQSLIDVNGIPVLPKDFLFKEGSLVFRSQGKDIRAIDTTVVQHKLELINVQFGEMGGDHAYVFKQQLPMEDEKEFSVPALSFLAAVVAARWRAKDQTSSNGTTF